MVYFLISCNSIFIRQHYHHHYYHFPCYNYDHRHYNDNFKRSWLRLFTTLKVNLGRYSEPCETSMIKAFAKIVKNFVLSLPSTIQWYSLQCTSAICIHKISIPLQVLMQLVIIFLIFTCFINGKYNDCNIQTLYRTSKQTFPNKQHFKNLRFFTTSGFNFLYELF